MKVLVVPHDLELGGSQLVALDLAAAVAGRGHQVVVGTVPGPLAELCRQAGLRLRTIDTPRSRPSSRVGAALRQMAREEKPDLVHCYGLWPLVETFFGTHLLGRLPLVVSMLSTGIDLHRIPDTVSLIVGGRPALADELRARRTAPVWAVPPPVDTAGEHPGVDGSGFRASLGIPATALVLVLVSRLDVTEKAAGIESAIRAVGRFAAPADDVRLVIVGGGPAGPALERLARELTPASGPGSVMFTGEQLDPRPAMAAADVALGRGVAVVRGMAYGTPAIVLGTAGDATLVSPDTVAHFERHGYLEGPPGPPGPATDLVELVAGLLADPDRRRRLGRLAREVAEGRSLERVGETLDGVYQQAVGRGVLSIPRTLGAGAPLTLRLAARPLRRLTVGPRRRWSGR